MSDTIWQPPTLYQLIERWGKVAQQIGEDLSHIEGYMSFWTCEHVVNEERRQPAGPFSARQMREYVATHTRRIGEHVIVSEWRAQRVRSWEQGL